MWMRLQVLRTLKIGLLMVYGVTLATGCERNKKAKPPAERATPAEPTLRIYALAGAAGAIEPCGCVRDMLGGIDHAAAFIKSQKKKAPHAIVLGAGPMFFADPHLQSGREEQGFLKAEALAGSLKDMNLLAWAPGANDWALGAKKFNHLTELSGAHPLAANLEKQAGAVEKHHLLNISGLKVGIVGVSIPRYSQGEVFFEIQSAANALKNGYESLTKAGAQITVALISAQRGEALRLVEGAPGYQIAIIGKAYDQGEANDKPYAPEIIGKTLTLQATNHLQGVSVVDLYVRDGDHQFQDGSGLTFLSRRASLESRISELKARVIALKKDKDILPADVKSQENKLLGLQKEEKALKSPSIPASGSFFQYTLVEVREDLGEDKAVGSRLSAYYQHVNQYNKKAFADLKPPSVPEGEAGYVGGQVCATCHVEEDAFWKTTRHANAYKTLSSDHKEFNLDCVSCHVTGYEKPGGSTVTHVEKLKNVQCEQCHGPGSLHIQDPTAKSSIVAMPAKDLCASKCHHAPHVGNDWKVEKAWPHILGKGHGLP